MRYPALLLPLLLSACAAPPVQHDPGTPSLANAQIDALRTALPGIYSDFSHQHGKGGQRPVTDVVIRHLTWNRAAAFLVSRKFRDGEVSQHQLYWFREGAGGEVLEARFAPLGEAQLSLPVPQLLDAAAERFRPGCAMVLAATPDGLTGQTDPSTCRFQHPEAGDVGLSRELNFGFGNLTFAERLVNSTGKPVGADGILRLQKHRHYDGWAGLLVDPDASAEDPGAWRLATSFSLSDDGRTVPLVDAAGDRLDFGLQLSRIKWRTDQPAILRLAVVRLGTGRIEAYAWSEPESRMIGINLDWFQAGLEAALD